MPQPTTNQDRLASATSAGASALSCQFVEYLNSKTKFRLAINFGQTDNNLNHTVDFLSQKLSKMNVMMKKHTIFAKKA